MNRKLTNALLVALAALSAPALAGDNKAPVAQAMVDDVNIGVAVSDEGRVPADTRPDDFVPGEDIYLTMDVSDAPPGTPIRVVWFGPGDQQIGTEAKTVAAGVSTLTFVKQDTRSWKPGNYRTEVWVGDEKVNDERFDVVSTRSARQ